jgi:general secretion pathway protein E
VTTIKVPDFSDYLLESEYVSANDLARAEEVRRTTGAGLPSTLARLGLIAEDDLVRALARFRQLPVIGRSDFPGDRPTIAGLNHRFLSRHSVLPLEIANDELIVAMADPDDEEARMGLAFAASLPIKSCVATFADIHEALGFGEQIGDDLSALGADLAGGAADDIARLLEDDSDAPVIRLVQRLLANAVNRRASDIHIEPMARHLSVRYRIDGRLQEVERHPDAFAGPIASRIKIMAGLDIAESRLPQDGRLRFTVRGREVDVRVSTSPISHGESIVLRLLGRSEVPLDLEKLGLPPSALEKLNRALDRPHGIGIALNRLPVFGQ